MNFKVLINWFLPERLRNSPLAADYDEVFTLASSCVFGAIILPSLYFVLWLAGYRIDALLYNGLLAFGLLFFIRKDVIRIPVYVMGILTYMVYFPYIADSGGVYSPLVGFLYIYLVGAYWGHRNSGVIATCLNLLLLIFLYYNTPAVVHLDGIASSAMGTLVIHMSGMLLLGTLLWMVHLRQDKAREEIKQLQNHRISMLDAEVDKRTAQLNTIRQSLATDFHDETGNLLSAIAIQASMLKLRIPEDNPNRPIVESIISNSNELYASSKHFLWNLNHNSQHPAELFEYLTGFGQSFYNQFDISFSAKSTCQPIFKIDPFVSLSLIFIFKEAMNNVVRHSGAREVLLEMHCPDDSLLLSLTDNGKWKAPDSETQHYGISNMKKRSDKYSLKFEIFQGNHGTKIQLSIPTTQSITR